LIRLFHLEAPKFIVDDWRDGNGRASLPHL